MQQEQEQNGHRFAAHPSLFSGASPQESDFSISLYYSVLKLPPNGESSKDLTQPLQPQPSPALGFAWQQRPEDDVAVK